MLAAMMRLTSTWGAVAMVLASSGCGGAPVAPPRPVEVSQTTPRKAPSIDVSSVPEPPSLIMQGRVKDLDAIATAIREWTRLPIPSGVELLRSIDSQQGLHGFPIRGQELAELITPSEPIDVAILLDASKRQPRIAVSAAVKSFDAASSRLAAHHKLSESVNGTLTIGPDEAKPEGSASSEDEDKDEDPDRCVLAHAVKGARLVCGQADAVDALAPYMARTLPRESWPSDLHLEFKPGPLRGPLELLRPQIAALASGGSSAMGAKAEAVDSTLSALLNALVDTQKLSLDATVSPSELALALRLDADSDTSSLTKYLTSGASGPAPAAYWKLPKDADTAYFRQGADAALLEGPRDLVGRVFMEEAEAAGVPEAERTMIRDALSSLAMDLFTKARVYGHGGDSAALIEATKTLREIDGRDDRARVAAKREVAAQAIGWHLVQLETPIANVTSSLSTLARVWNRPSFRKWVNTQASREDLPQVTLQAPTARLGLPKESFELALSLPTGGAAATKGPGAAPKRGTKGAPKASSSKPTVLHVVAVPDGSATWLAVGFDEATLARKLSAVLSSTGAPANLAAAPGLEPLRDARLHAGGFTTLVGIMSVAAADGGRGSSALRVLSAPHRGASPLFFTYALEPRDAKPASAVTTLRLSRAVIDDIVSLALKIH